MKGFKEFILRGNIVDMAVGVIIGGAMGKIVASLVNDILMPLVGMALGGLDFTTLQVTVGTAVVKYGLFIQNIIDFLIIGFTIYMILKIAMNAHNKLNKNEEEEEEPILGPTEVELLTEIRDLLNNK